MKKTPSPFFLAACIFCAMTPFTSLGHCEETLVEIDFSDTCRLEVDVEPDPERSQQHPLIEVKAGYFFFTDSVMRHVYDQGGVNVQLCGSYPVYQWLYVYGSVGYTACS